MKKKLIQHCTSCFENSQNSFNFFKWCRSYANIFHQTLLPERHHFYLPDQGKGRRLAWILTYPPVTDSMKNLASPSSYPLLLIIICIRITSDVISKTILSVKWAKRKWVKYLFKIGLCWWENLSNCIKVWWFNETELRRDRDRSNAKYRYSWSCTVKISTYPASQLVLVSIPFKLCLNKPWRNSKIFLHCTYLAP